ncbi:MAG: U32 family peptidase [Clostridia bacterium]|nr:U32 family peptidase [Clostridia bacterium]
MRKVELLAPAGNFECLVAAVQSGADAVYFAGKSFGARNFADNFDRDELKKAVDYCHLRSVNAYVTVNTLVLDSEMEELCDYLRFLSAAGVDAIIVQDMGVLELAREIVPDLPIHASTQMTIHNIEGVKFLEKMGVKRVVLSRELSAREIKEISENTSAELEVFIHGALCMSYSGQCLFSSMIGGRSGNRGKCAQPCRLPYSINNSRDKAFFLSLKDLMGINYLDELSRNGVLSFKIEGRMKGAAYVAAVVGVYRKYIDDPDSVTADDIKILESIFNRGGYTDGYLSENQGKDMFAPHKPDNPYLKETLGLEKELLSVIKNESRKIKISGKAIFKNEAQPTLCLNCGDIKIEYKHNMIPEKARNAALDASTVMAQLSKTGGTPFEFSEISVDIEDGLFLSAGELNKIRREALKILEEKIIWSFERTDERKEYDDKISNCDVQPTEFVCEITKDEQLEAVKDLTFDKFYIPIGIIERNRNIADTKKEKTVIVLPAILRNDEYASYTRKAKILLDDGYHGVLIHNVSLINEFSGYNIYGGFRLNVANSHSLEFLRQAGIKAVELSPELNFRQIEKMAKPLPVGIMVYGRLPVVVSENCLIRNGDKCPCSGENSITDRLGITFPVIKDGDICRSVILNSKKTVLLGDMDKIKNINVGFVRLYFTDETPDDCRKISNAFLEGGEYSEEDFTRGHFNKGFK